MAVRCRFSKVWAVLLGVLATQGCAIDVAKPESPYFDQFKYHGPEPAPASSAMLRHEVATYSLPDDVFALAWSPDGKALAVSFDHDKRVTLLNTRTGRRAWTVERGKYNVSPHQRVLVFSPDGQNLFTAAGTRSPADAVTVISTRDGRVESTYSYVVPVAGLTAVDTAVLSRDGRTLFAVPGMSRELVSFDVTSGKWTKLKGFSSDRVNHDKGFYANRVAIEEARDLLIWSHSATVNVWHLRSGDPISEFRALNLRVNALQLNPKTGEVVVGGDGVYESSRDPDDQIREYHDDPPSLVRGFDPITGERLHVYEAPGYTVEGLSVSSDGKLVAATKSSTIGPTPAYLHLWDAETGKLLASRSYGQASVGDVAFNSDGSLLAVAEGSTIHILKLAR